jgi:hypothetical protein
MDFVKKIPPAWAAIAVLIIIVIVLLFSQRRSGYTPTAGAPITLMDLQEFSGFTTEQKTMYSNLLTTSDVLSQLKQAAASNSVGALQSVIMTVMNRALGGSAPPPPPPVTQPSPPPTMNPPPPPPMTPQSKCNPGTYSPTGSPPCIACPMNTFCPDLGMTDPKNCPPGYKSMIAATSCTPMK